MRSTSHRRKQHNGARYVVPVGRTSAKIPPLRDGDIRCLVCRNRARLRKDGEHLHAHNDLFGHKCYNVAVTL